MSHSIFRKDGTAQGVAKQRLIENLAEPDRRVISDPYAERFVAGAGVMKLMGHKLNVGLARKLAPGFHEHLMSRTRFIDELIKDCVDNGAEQYVILGAGYDSRAHRLELPATLRIFEVDQLEVQERKRSKLPDDLPNSENVTYVSVDFNVQSLTDQLLAAGFDQGKSTVFTLEGVSQYVAKEAIAATIAELKTLTQGASSTLFMSYVDELVDTDPAACFGKGYPNAARRAKTIMGLSAKVGEPWISFYTVEEMAELLSDNGFTVSENLSFTDLNAAYFAPVGREVPENEVMNLERFVVAKS